MASNNTNNEDDDILVTLELDDGTQAECEILTIFTVGEQDYIALPPLDEKGEPNEDGEVFIYRYFETKKAILLSTTFRMMTNTKLLPIVSTSF